MTGPVRAHLILNDCLKGCGGGGSRCVRVRMGCIGTWYVCGDICSVFRSLWVRVGGHDLSDSEGQGRYFVEAWVRYDDIHELQRI